MEPFLYIQSNYIHVRSMQFYKQAPFKSHSNQTAKAIILFYLVCKLHIDQSLNTVYNLGDVLNIRMGIEYGNWNIPSFFLCQACLHSNSSLPCNYYKVDYAYVFYLSKKLHMINFLFNFKLLSTIFNLQF